MANPTRNILSLEDGKRAQRMREQGYSNRRIGELLGVNHSTVKRAIDRVEVEEKRQAVKPSRDWKGSDIRSDTCADPGRHGNPIIIEGQPKSLTAAFCGDPSPERWAFIHGTKGQTNDRHNG